VVAGEIYGASRDGQDDRPDAVFTMKIMKIMKT